jgi:hypothetical protein
MSLSNYIIDLETEQKIYLPQPDTLYQNIFINKSTYLINYYVNDFKYNLNEKLFYISYFYNNNAYLATLAPNGKAFITNEILYSLDDEFSYIQKNTCLSWDGKMIFYCMNGEDCFKYATVAEIQAIAKKYGKR